jgi:multidrug efflux pump subunit AcrB
LLPVFWPRRSTLDVTFELGTNVNMDQVLVQNRLAIAEPTLPDVVRTIGVSTKKRSPDVFLGSICIPRTTRRPAGRIMIRSI